MKTGNLTAVVLIAASCLLANDGAAPAGKRTAAQAATPPAPVVKQTLCPVMGGEINKEIFVDVAGKRIYLCCKGCAEAIRKEPLKYIEKMTAAGIALDPVPAPPKGTKAAGGR